MKQIIMEHCISFIQTIEYSMWRQTFACPTKPESEITHKPEKKCSKEGNCIASFKQGQQAINGDYSRHLSSILPT